MDLRARPAPDSGQGSSLGTQVPHMPRHQVGPQGPRLQASFQGHSPQAYRHEAELQAGLCEPWHQACLPADPGNAILSEFQCVFLQK